MILAMTLGLCFVCKVILVVSEEARNSLPEELSVGLVLTIYEAKGLEFDDVLLYNFFTDSQVHWSKTAGLGACW
jgi:hypothetical protein